MCVVYSPNPIVIPGRREAAGPESITTSREYGFADAQLRIELRDFVAPRNDEATGDSMASIHKDIPIDAPAHEVWDAVRDFGALHTRLVPGFVLDTKLDGDVRIVTFANGTVAREQLVDCDDARRGSPIPSPASG